MNATRTQHVRAWFRGHPGHLGPNPDQLVVGLLGVIVVVGVALALLAALGHS